MVVVAAVFEVQLASGMSTDSCNLREYVCKDPGVVSGILRVRCNDACLCVCVLGYYCCNDAMNDTVCIDRGQLTDPHSMI